MWGSANGGRLGLGPRVRDSVVVPTLVRDLVARQVRVWQVSCGSAHSALCTEVTSELRGGSKKLLGGQVFVCGGAQPLGRYVSSWEHVARLADVAVKQVSCGVAHTAAVSAYGELYTWGRNDRGCTGHSVEVVHQMWWERVAGTDTLVCLAQRAFIPEPELLRSLHVEPYNLALSKPCRQINVYNEQGAQLAVNGDVDGRLERCIHTHVSVN
ncbi:hypothetical protein PINS_up016567 [Pythium insidiosum]|nr:hypothetical protein PINS_up016567 [Pythium insidiosum]